MVDGSEPQRVAAVQAVGLQLRVLPDSEIHQKQVPS
jgi:hypothetical protein